MLKEQNIVSQIFQVIWFFIVLFLGVNVAHYGDNWFAGSSVYWGLVGQAIPIILGLFVLIWFLYKKRKERKRQELKQQIKAEILQELGI
ncbi:hypothetical protein EC917_15010 [Bacillus thuringiensis]|uniref:Uncharacterized protein n=1 Tax=Bacillus thuringiensis TaxID=1428 RepID=A0A4R4AU51_BACTU|nr:hypothetical protein [Bacillus thuringiensis]TCW43080.1 hypothetical protein EC917_15010 [Bacillus thuringiensis]TCW43591.1 hypothetical protein EC910_1492 [Bacillus thuringiensis]